MVGLRKNMRLVGLGIVTSEIMTNFVIVIVIAGTLMRIHRITIVMIYLAWKTSQ